MSLITPSEEQQLIIDIFCAGYNIKVEAVAGSGKTASLLFLSKIVKEKFNVGCLLLTYNKDLKDDIDKRLCTLGLNSHVKAYTYHGFASSQYGMSIHNDVLLHSKVDQKITKKTPDVIFLDEVQDMNDDYYKLVNNILSHGKLLVIVGDPRQCINEHIGSTDKFLINNEQYFNTGRPWRTLKLRTSYRMTPAIANFVNKHVLKQDIIIGGNLTAKNDLPIYKYNAWNMNILLNKMVRKYGPDEVALLLPSLNSTRNPNSPISKLINGHDRKILFNIKSENESFEVGKGKVSISTYSSMKGRQKKCIFLLCFDESYFDYYNKVWNKPDELPNILYVASTRASDMLIIIQDTKTIPLRTIIKENLHEDCKIIGSQNDIVFKPASKNNISRVTGLIKHRTLKDILMLISLTTVKTLNPIAEKYSAADIIKFNGYIEDVKSFYGTLIPIYTEYLLYGSTHLNTFSAPSDNNFDDIQSIFMDLLYNNNNKSLREWMELIISYISMRDGCHFYKDQITNYNWVDEEYILKMCDRLMNMLPTNGLFEKYIKYNSIEAYIDYVVNDEIWEFKCTSSLTDDHKIQCAAYVSLMCIVNEKYYIGKLFNICTGELLVIEVDDPENFLLILANK